MFNTITKRLKTTAKNPKTLLSRAGLLGFVLVFAGVGVAALLLTRAQTPTVSNSITTWPTEPPARICGNASILGGGPTTAPAGAVTVPAGDNGDFFRNESYKGAAGAGITYWFEPGVHTFSGGEYANIIANNNTSYIGAPGAILDGKNVSRFAFTGQGSGVTIKYLTIQNFGSPPFQDSTGAWRGGNNNEAVVNTAASANWTVERNTIARNHGVGLFSGNNFKASYNCIDSNGQHGFGGYRPKVPGASSINNVTLDHNEISNNNTDDWEAKIPVCGCTGGGKFWDTNGGVVTNNWMHDNKSVGFWADVNNIDFIFEGNYIENNDDEGLFYELSYNAVIRKNTFKRNAIKKGQKFASRNDGTPAGAIYISESGGDSRVSYTKTGTPNLEISSNYFEDNWDGISLYEGANRYCGNPLQPETGGEAKTGYCTIVNPDANFTTCNDPTAGGKINVEPYYSDCRHKTQNVLVQDNEFRFNAANLGNCNPRYCGRMALYSDIGTTSGAGTSWNPYLGSVIQDATTFKQNNKFINNRYFGNWKFMARDGLVEFGSWLAPPYNQDAGSTSDVMSRLNNHLDKDTETFEGSTGHWSSWYNTTILRTATVAQSGSASMKTDISARDWGVSLDNYPGFAATPGNKTVSFWAMSGSGSPNVTMRIKWRDASNNDVQTDMVAVASLTSTWQQAKKDVVAPAGTAKVFVELFGTNGAVGNIAYFDDFFVGDQASNTSPPADTIAPTTSLTAPTNGATVSGQATLEANAADNVAVTKVEFYDGVTKLGEDNASPYVYTWDTSTVSSGSHTLTTKAYDAAGNSTTSSPVTVNVSNAAADTQPPTAPISLTATPASATRVDLKWSAATDNVGISKYYVVRNGTTIAELGNTTLTYADTSLSPSTKYDYYVLAKDAAGNVSPASSTTSATTQALADTTPPSTPTNLAATAASSSQVNLTWSASTDNVGVTGYRVYRNDKGLVPIATVTGTSFGDANLAANTAYTYYITAIDAAGNSSQLSNEVSVTTPAVVSNGSISGTVSSSRGGVLSGARVKLTVNGVNYTYSTNSSGTYQITNIPAGQYTATYTAKQHAAQTTQVTVTAGNNSTKNITLQRR